MRSTKIYMKFLWEMSNDDKALFFSPIITSHRCYDCKKICCSKRDIFIAKNLLAMRKIITSQNSEQTLSCHPLYLLKSFLAVAPNECLSKFVNLFPWNVQILFSSFTRWLLTTTSRIMRRKSWIFMRLFFCVFCS